MPRISWIHGSLLGLIGFSFGLGACFFDSSGTCTQTGSCVQGTQGADPGDDGSSGDPGNGGGAVPCSDDAACDDGNGCTTDACVSGKCQQTAVADGEVAAKLGCQEITCVGGAETSVPLAATTLCEGGQVCDGAGSCVACDGSDPSRACPDGLACGADGTCALPLGADCSGGGACASGHCVDGVCCGVSCTGVCMGCDAAQDYAACTFTSAYQNNADCTEGQACDGAGQCKLLDGESCIQNTQCLSGDCTGGLSGTCAP